MKLRCLLISRWEWNGEGYEDICRMYDRYHLCKALVNILNNSVEAIEQSGKEEGKITVRLEFFVPMADHHDPG